jgi:hypothetical protein
MKRGAHRELERSDQQFIRLVQEREKEEHDNNKNGVEISLPFHFYYLIHQGYGLRKCTLETGESQLPFASFDHDCHYSLNNFIYKNRGLGILSIITICPSMGLIFIGKDNYFHS